VLSSELQSLSSLLAGEAVAEPITPLLLSQIGVGSGLFIGGNALEAFGNVEEPKEVGVEEGEPDIYRDSLLRYCGYANEVGEAFRPLVPVELVYISYVVAIAYILADTFDKGSKGAAAGGVVFATLGALDTFLWQMLASVVFPSFCINRLVTLLISLQSTLDLPELLTNEYVPTAAGLLAIPLLITPLDVLAHWVLNGSFRSVKGKILS